jgi:hypothetical protein
VRWLKGGRSPTDARASVKVGPRPFCGLRIVW